VPRKLRENVEGGVYHVYARGNDRACIYYRDDADRERYLELLEKVASGKDWRCLAYCLMDNHLHLLLETPSGGLSAGMQRLHGRYAQSFNRRHERSGHLFQGRFGDVRILSDRQVLAVAGYMARNPVDAGICADPARWRWSSYGKVIGGGEPEWLDASRLLSYFGSKVSAARRRYAAVSCPLG